MFRMYGAYKDEGKFVNSLVFSYRCFVFPQETVCSFAKLLSSLRATVKFLGEMQMFCMRTKTF